MNSDNMKSYKYSRLQPKYSMNFDELLKSIGEFGPYQKFIFLLLCLPSISTGLQKFVWYFIIMEPKYRCMLVTDRLINGSTLPYELTKELLNKTIPYDKSTHQYSQCERYKTHTKATPIFSNWTVYDEEMRFTRDAETCPHYIYDTSEYTSTLVSEFNLVCSHSWEQANGQAIYVVGEFIAAILAGYMADRFGRRRVILTGVCCHILFAFLSACSPSYVILLIFRLVMGFSAACMYLPCFVIIMEFVGPSYRMEAGVGCNYFFSFGYLLVLPFAYFIRQWRYLQMAVTLPALGLLSYFWILPESPRWLMANNKFEDSKAILERVAASNTTSLPKDLKLEDMDEDSTPNEETYTHLTLVKYPKLRIRIIISCYMWFVSSCVYYGLTLNTSDIGGNVYINFLISAALEFPANFLTTYLIRYLGRVRGLSLTLLLAGIALIATCAVPKGSVAVMITLALIGKFAISISFNIIYIHAGEVFPTVVRNTALGMCSSCARIGSISAPYISLLSAYWAPLPLVVFGAESLLAAVLALILPETRNKTLPETIADGENFGVKSQTDANIASNTHLNSTTLSIPKYGDSDT